jgi:predicted patatin/cPLA2 family phospholipase
MAKEHKGKLQNGENYITSKTTEWRNTKRQILQNGERQNVENCRMAKDKMLNLTERQIQNVKNTKRRKTLNGKKKIGRIGLYMKTISFILHGN